MLALRIARDNQVRKEELMMANVLVLQALTVSDEIEFHAGSALSISCKTASNVSYSYC